MVDGCLVHFAPYPHEDCNDDEDEEDAARDTKNLQSNVLLQEAGEIPVYLHDGLVRHCTERVSFSLYEALQLMPSRVIGGCQVWTGYGIFYS